MTDTVETPEYDASVMALVRKLSDAMEADDAEFSVRINALLMLLALTGAQSTLSKNEFHAAVLWQLNEIRSRISVIETPLQ